MEYLQQLVEAYKNELPILAAFVLGLMTAISPCPLATNITATVYLSKNISKKSTVLLNGIFYTLGRMFSYTALGLLLYFGASQLKIIRLLQNIGGLWLGVAMVIAGVLMLELINFKIPFLDKLQPTINENNHKKGYLNAFFLGMVFALAFCPFSGVLYFGVLIPMTLVSFSGLLLPPVFSLATGLPVIVTSVIIAYSMANIGNFYSNVKVFEKWFKRAVSVVFIVVGIYYIVIYI